jgi:hypothetical protein
VHYIVVPASTEMGIRQPAASSWDLQGNLGLSLSHQEMLALCLKETKKK